jgi:hypothetical protein
MHKWIIMGGGRRRKVKMVEIVRIFSVRKEEPSSPYPFSTYLGLYDPNISMNAS